MGTFESNHGMPPEERYIEGSNLNKRTYADDPQLIPESGQVVQLVRSRFDIDAFLEFQQAWQYRDGRNIGTVGTLGQEFSVHDLRMWNLMDMDGETILTTCALDEITPDIDPLEKLPEQS